MNKITENTETSQGEIKEPVTVQAAIEDLIFDYSNLQHWVGEGECKSEAIQFLKQNLEIAYAKESAAGLELALQALYLVLEDKMEKYQIINSILAIQYVVTKIKGAKESEVAA